VGRLGEAITLHEQNLADRERLLGPDHPNAQISRNNLAAAVTKRAETFPELDQAQQQSTAAATAEPDRPGPAQPA